MSWIWDDIEGDYVCKDGQYGRKSTMIEHDSSKHYPNKNEARKLREIMSSTGLSEKEVRSSKKYCKMLSDAQKEGQKAKRTNKERFYYLLIKRACQDTGLAKEHPDTLTVLEILIEKRFKDSMCISSKYDKLSAKKVVELYGKKKK